MRGVVALGPHVHSQVCTGQGQRVDAGGGDAVARNVCHSLWPRLPAMRRYWWNKPEALRRSPGVRSSRNTKASPLRLLKKSVGSSQSDLIFYVAVLVIAAGTRSLLAIFESGSFYFPDSWCYVIVSPNAPCSSGHSPAVTWFWQIGTFGNLTEHSVLLLQSVLGVMSALLLFRALRLLSTAKWAMVGASLFAVLPVELFFERAFMAESTETFFVCLFLVTAAESLGVSPW